MGFPQNDLQFEQLTIEDGLPGTGVLDVLQDKLGFIWIGTYGGLFRYDGFTLKNYRNDPFDSTSISKSCRSGPLYEDRSGRLSGSAPAAGGLNRYDRFERHIYPVHETSRAIPTA